MSRKTLLVSIAAFLAAAMLALLTAALLVSLVERRTEDELTEALGAARLDWTRVAVDGLTITLSGTAPSESARIRALQVAGEVVDASRLGEEIVVPTSSAIVAPVFRIEVMRNRQDLSVIGLVPAQPEAGGTAGEGLVDRLAAAMPDLEIEDMLQTSDHAVPAGWGPAVDFALQALQRFEVGRISVAAGRIEVEALVDTPEARRTLEEALRAVAPRGQVLTLDLVAPRPVAAPFLLRVDASGGALTLGSCVADTVQAQERITAALRAAGVTQRINCPLALGAPTPRWGEGAAVGIAALADLGEGSLTISDGSVLLSVPHTVATADFDRVVGRLETAMPGAFSVTGRQLEAPVDEAAQGSAAPEVQLILTEEGRFSVAGRLPDERIRATISAFSAARFGTAQTEIATRLDPDLPTGWSVRVLTVIEALAELHHGRATVRADRVSVSGVTGNPDGRAQVTQALLQGLGSDAAIEVDVRYDEALDPVANAPTPDNCEARIHDILAETKITFDPGSTEINREAGRVLDRIAEVLRECGELPFEVAGFTDSQGREQTNLNLSQARAEAVINGLLSRRVLVASLVARGYGAADPIADNGTEAGREANRRIEFRLVRDEAEPEAAPLDPALEAQLTFEIQTPDGDTIRPQPRPGSEPPVDDSQGSGD